VSEHAADAGTPAGAVYTAAEADALHQDDRRAAGNIVKLMVGIFLGGIVLYSIVAMICAR
jgi:hypothetical protein